MNYRLQVDSYKEKNHLELLCFCSTFNMPYELENGYILKSLTWAEICAYVKKNKDEDWKGWVKNHKGTDSFCNVLAEIINVKENRVETWTATIENLLFPECVDAEFVVVDEKPDMFNAIAAITKPDYVGNTVLPENKNDKAA